MSDESSEPYIKSILPCNIVENGALILVCGCKRSGKTCVVENAIFESIESFLTKDFSPLYFGSSSEQGRKYFGKLFGDYLSHSDANQKDNRNRAIIWQQGYQKEVEDSQFKRQGDDYVKSKANTIAMNRNAPRFLFFFDNCDTKETLDYASQCLFQTKDHRASKQITVIESCLMLYLGSLKPQILIFTSGLDKNLHVTYFQEVLKCSKALANDLVETANTFIDPCGIALLINLNQWFATDKKRGLFIYEYNLVPPLDEQLAAKSIVEKGIHHRHRHRRRHHKSSEKKSN